MKASNPRSVLHALEPMGIGTPEIESLLSYLCRLAVSHSTSTLSLSRAVAHHFEHAVEEQFDWYHRQLSGVGESALTWSSALSALTSVPRLDLLTFLPWKDVIAQNGLPIVSKGQFCTHCLAEDLATGKAPYFRLAWESKAVTVCAKHLVRLTQHCPCCGMDNVRHAAAFVVPGWCTKCGAFLGSAASDAPTSTDPAELWRARQVGELVSAHSQLATPPQRQNLMDAVQHLIEEMDGGQSARFAKRIGLSKGTVHYWLQTDKTPTLEASLMVAAQSGIGLTLLLQGDTRNWTPPTEGQQLPLELVKPPTHQRSARRHLDWVDIEVRLKKFLMQPTPISVREAARQLDLEPRQLYLNVNQTARQLAARWLAYLKRRRQSNLDHVMPILENAGREVLMEGKALNLREISARVPQEVISSIPGIFGILKSVQSNLESALDSDAI